MSGYVRDASLRSGIFQTRRGPAASVAALVLEDGEPGYEVDTGRFVVGDGSTRWASLPSEGHGAASDIGVSGLTSLVGSNVQAVLSNVDARLPTVESDNLAQGVAIGCEVSARATADDALGTRVTALEAGGGTPAEPWMDVAYTRRKAVTVDGTALAADLANAIVRVDLTGDTDLAARSRADRRDVVFADADDVPLPFMWEDIDPSVLAGNAVTTWYTDPRAVYHAGASRRLYFGHVADAGYLVTGGGDIIVQSVDIDTGGSQRFVLHSALQRDDHANPALIFLPNGNLVCFYSSHFGPAQRYRICTAPEDLGNPASWGAEQTLAWSAPFTTFSYSNPYLLSGEGTPGTGRVYIFWRDDTFAPSFTYSDDNCATWAAPKELIMGGVGGAGRPYVKYESNGVDRIDLFFTQAHPDSYQTDVFHAYIQGGLLHKSDGTSVGAIGSGPYLHTKLTKIYDHATDGRAWTHDVALDATGKPVVVFATFPGAPLPPNVEGDYTADHHYWYARWTGTAWDAHLVAVAGPTINPVVTGAGIAPDEFYSAGICLDHRDPARIYLCRRVASQFELERRVTTDGGATWGEITPITTGSAYKNFRPVSPRTGGLTIPGLPEVMWLHGSYVGYVGASAWKCYPPLPGRTPKVARVLVPTLSGSATTAIQAYYNRAGEVAADPQADALIVPNLIVLATMDDVAAAGVDSVRDLAGSGAWLLKGSSPPSPVAGRTGKGQQFIPSVSRMQIGNTYAGDPAIYPKGMLNTGGFTQFGFLFVFKLTGPGADVSGVKEHVLGGDFNGSPTRGGVYFRVRNGKVNALIGLADGTTLGVQLGGDFNTVLSADGNWHVVVVNYTTAGVLSARVDGVAQATTYTTALADKRVVATVKPFAVGSAFQGTSCSDAIFDEFVWMNRPITADEELLYS